MPRGLARAVARSDDRLSVSDAANPYPGRASWLDRFGEVSEWVRELGITSRDPHNQMFTLERIGRKGC